MNIGGSRWARRVLLSLHLAIEEEGNRNAVYRLGLISFLLRSAQCAYHLPRRRR